MPGMGMGKIRFKQGGSPAPTLDSATASETRGIACGVTWKVTASWTTTYDNDSLYETRIYLYPGNGSLLQTGTSADGQWEQDTGETGDVLESGTPHSRQYTIKLVRLSDDFVMAQADTNTVSVETGASC